MAVKDDDDDDAPAAPVQKEEPVKLEHDKPTKAPARAFPVNGQARESTGFRTEERAQTSKTAAAAQRRPLRQGRGGEEGRRGVPAAAASA